jgi:hypothetical protein
MLSVDEQNGQLDERIGPNGEPQLQLTEMTEMRPWPVDAEHVLDRDARHATDLDDGDGANAHSCDMELRLDLKPPLEVTIDSCASADPDGQSSERATHSGSARACGSLCCRWSGRSMP